VLIDQVQLLLLQTAKALVTSVVILAAALVGFRLWRSTLRRLANRLRRRAENHSRERQVRLQTLAAVGQATGAALLGSTAGLMILGQFVNISPLLAGASVVGLAIGLGAKSLIRDVIAGFFILLEDHFGVDDRITVNDRYSGRVEHLDLRRTVLRNIQDGSVMTIPNGEIRAVANTTKGWSQAVVDIHVDYAEDIDRVLAVLDRAGDELQADSVEGAFLLGQPEVLGVENLGESHVTMRVLLKTQPGRQARVGRRYRRIVKNGLDREGVALPGPQQLILAEPVGSGGYSAQAREVFA
jgi:moderate conductance mechanosensitive channel